MKIQHGACALHAAYLRIQTYRVRNTYLLLIHCNNLYANAPECYVVRTLPVFFQNDESGGEEADHSLAVQGFYLQP